VLLSRKPALSSRAGTGLAAAMPASEADRKYIGRPGDKARLLAMASGGRRLARRPSSEQLSSSLVSSRLVCTRASSGESSGGTVPSMCASRGAALAAAGIAGEKYPRRAELGNLGGTSTTGVWDDAIVRPCFGSRRQRD
jgi:hypothetical protein